MAGLSSPLENLQRYQAKLDRETQFSEDIRHVLAGGYGCSSSGRGDNVGTSSSRQRGVRARSPGLAAGAALALSGAAGGPDPHTVARQLKEQARGTSCPFDDHSAFARREAQGLGGLLTAEARANVPSGRPPTPSQQREAHEASRNAGRQIRDAQKKVGSAAPWDAPETSMPTSTYAATSAAVAAASAGVPEAGARGGYAGGADTRQLFADSRREAANHRTRMVNSSDNIISGGYLLGESRTAVPVGRSAHRPPQPEGLLPQAMLKAQMDGLGRPSQERAAFLNARVMSEAIRERNCNSLVPFG